MRKLILLGNDHAAGRVQRQSAAERTGRTRNAIPAGDHASNGNAGDACPTPPSDTTPPADNTTPAFVDKVWRVEAGGTVEAGSTYAFLSGGTLVIDAPHGTPMTGSWAYADGKLTMTEEGITYPTDIVSLDASHFTIRSHNPGGVVEIAMVAAPDVPLPSAQ